MTDKSSKNEQVSDEMAAMATVYAALRPLDADTQRWILRSIMDRLGLGTISALSSNAEKMVVASIVDESTNPTATTDTQRVSEGNDLESPSEIPAGISPLAQKWMMRSGLTAKNLSSIYSLNFDEIDLVSQAVPGTSRRERMKNVLLLKAIASYLSSGAARVSHDKAKEACMHYDAFDPTNFATYVKGFSREIAGSRETGYSLTPAGMTVATSLIQRLTEEPQSAKTSHGIVRRHVAKAVKSPANRKKRV